MTPAEKEKITDLKKCNFREMCEFFKAESEKRKNRTKEEKKVSLSSRERPRDYKTFLCSTHLSMKLNCS